jgi:phosphoglycolate phosphatase-like HAD superfamily hydrolase
MSGPPDLLALDFDGVICDGLREYFQVAWRAHCQLWADETTDAPSELAAVFYRLRPIVETGWEMPVVIHALRSGFSESEILRDWPNLSLELLQHHQASPHAVGQVVDGLRDQWIEQDLAGWLAEHRFYSGVIDRLKQVENFVIISTKESRFIRQLLAQAGLNVRNNQIFGKEQQRPKADVLRALQPQYQSIWFIEDRFKTLENVAQQPDLINVQLFLADWGYNLSVEREKALQSARIQPINLSQFSASFDQWIRPSN